MSETIYQRVRRILSAKVEDAVDRMERQNNEAVMAQAIREVEGALDEARAAHDDAKTRRLQAARAQKTFVAKSAEVVEKAQFALQVGREDLAEAAIGRQMDFQSHAQSLQALQDETLEQEERLAETVAALETRKQEMEAALNAFRVARAEVATGGVAPSKPSGVERKAERAEQAFARAMGGAGFAPSDAEAVRAVAEIDAMKRKADIAARLNSLKQGAAAP